MNERHQKEQERLREAIMNAALKLATDKDWSAVSIRKIAGEIDYSTTKVYELFANKDHLVLELLRRGFVLLAEELKAAVAQYHDPMDRAVAFARAYSAFAWDHGAYYRIMYGMDGVPFGVTETRQEGIEIGMISTQVVRELVPQASEHQLERYVFACWGTLHGIVSLYMAQRLYGDREEAAQLAVEALQYSLGVKRPDST
ncbi:putative transcriptional regulator [Bacillus sp. TS-2]|nr:putative transcriptional regulator [Bacillus sp. TS-2]